MDERRSRPVWPFITAGLAAVSVIAIVVALLVSGDDDGGGGAETTADVQTISFQQPEDPGEDPFTPPADVEGDDEVEISASTGSGSGGDQQPFGGSGSNRVCDRDKLIRFLKANPERMREWARVLGIEPRLSAVKKYIAKLHPVTLTRDTQVTNHAFKNGRAVPFQAILQAGTAVLVDKYGTPVVRCFCGNPLGPPVVVRNARCTGCPPDYKPPRQCEFGRRSNYDKTYYRKDYYANGDYDEVFIKSHRSSRYADCYEPYPDPPVVTTVSVYKRPPPEPEPAPAVTQPTPQPAPEPTPEPQGLQCDPPRSQLEAEQCAELEGNAPQHEPTPQPEPTPPPTDICNDGQDNEGEPGLIDGDDPNCQ